MTTMLQQVKDAGEDFEWYPTTPEIIDAVLADMRVQDEDAERRHWFKWPASVLDIGAGDGRVLKAMHLDLRCQVWNPDKYGIEKSLQLCGALSEHAFVIGTDLFAQSLLSKSVDMTFCNPPYSEFERWVVKIIRETASRLVYLVIPTRWIESTEIADALAYREAELTVVGQYDFLNAERRARAVVNLIRIEFRQSKDDAFERFFDEQFSHLKARYAEAESEGGRDTRKAERQSALVHSRNIVESLVALYDRDMAQARRNYELAAALDVDLLRELHVTPDNILKCLKLRLEGLRNEYWSELFANMQEVTTRLCTKQRERLLGTLNANGHVDFTEDNAYAVLLWVLRHAAKYMDEQTVEVFNSLVGKANVRNYVSNQRVYEWGRWRYNEDKPTHIALEYRLVLEHAGGIERDPYDANGRTGMCERACTVLRDLMTVANNLGFLCDNTDTRLMATSWRTAQGWVSGGKQEFLYHIPGGKSGTLLEVRAFLNGNMHIRMAQDFALALNVEAGRLQGWLRTPAEAASELKDDKAAGYFNTAFRLGAASVHRLMPKQGPKRRTIVR